MKKENEAHSQEWWDGYSYGKTEARDKANKYQVICILFGLIFAIQIVNWLVYPKTVCWPAEDENAVDSTTTQPFHKTQKLLLRWHKEDGTEGWAFQSSGGWQYIHFGNDDN